MCSVEGQHDPVVVGVYNISVYGDDEKPCAPDTTTLFYTRVSAFRGKIREAADELLK